MWLAKIYAQIANVTIVILAIYDNIQWRRQKETEGTSPFQTNASPFKNQKVAKDGKQPTYQPKVSFDSRRKLKFSLIF